jgi:hypothetical protein
MTQSQSEFVNPYEPGVFINRINISDERYSILETIPIKEYDPEDGSIYVYLWIKDDKDYYLVYVDFEFQLQTLIYYGNRVTRIETHLTPIPDL